MGPLAWVLGPKNSTSWAGELYRLGWRGGRGRGWDRSSPSGCNRRVRARGAILGRENYACASGPESLILELGLGAPRLGLGLLVWSLGFELGIGVPRLGLGLRPRALAHVQPSSQRFVASSLAYSASAELA